MNSISIITACSRPQNLDLLKESITFPCDWYIIYDSEKIERIFEEGWIHTYNLKGGVSGYNQKNYGLSLVDGGWVYFLDDDNVLHPKFFDLFSIYTKLYPEKSAFVFNQQCSPDEKDVRWAIPSNVQTYKIDQAQWIVKRELIGFYRFGDRYESDGDFITTLHEQHSTRFGYLLTVMSYYNYLKWEDKGG
jgi:hypothetical protein